MNNRMKNLSDNNILCKNNDNYMFLRIKRLINILIDKFQGFCGQKYFYLIMNLIILINNCVTSFNFI